MNEVEDPMMEELEGLIAKARLLLDEYEEHYREMLFLLSFTSVVSSGNYDGDHVVPEDVIEALGYLNDIGNITVELVPKIDNILAEVIVSAYKLRSAGVNVSVRDITQMFSDFNAIHDGISQVAKIMVQTQREAYNRRMMNNPALQQVLDILRGTGAEQRADGLWVIKVNPEEEDDAT